MLTRKRWQPPTGLTGEVAKLTLAIQNYLLSLELDGALALPDRTEWTPTVSASANTITTATASGVHFEFPNGLKTYFVEVLITTNGTGSGVVQFTLPQEATVNSVGCGRAENVSGNQLQVRVLAGSSTAIIANYDGTYPGADGELLIVSGSYC